MPAPGLASASSTLRAGPAFATRMMPGAVQRVLGNGIGGEGGDDLYVTMARAETVAELATLATEGQRWLAPATRFGATCRMAGQRDRRRCDLALARKHQKLEEAWAAPHRHLGNTATGVLRAAKVPADQMLRRLQWTVCRASCSMRNAPEARSLAWVRCSPGHGRRARAKQKDDVG